MTLRLAELAVRFGVPLEGDPDVRIARVGTLSGAGPDALGFLANPRYRAQLETTAAGAVIVAEEDARHCPVPALISANPYALYARIAALLHPEPSFVPGIHPSASVADGVRLGEACHVGPGAVIEAGAALGARVFVGPGCVVGRDAAIGDDSRLHANVTVCHAVILGARAIVHPGAVIGSDGFGLAREPEGWVKVPQLGRVLVGDDVEIGACTTIDRGAIEDTVIGDGVKLDNNIQIAHNVSIGEHTVIAACTGVSGSTRIGRRCLIAGAVGFVGHLEVTDDVTITGQTMVNRSIREPGVYSSALPMDEARRWRRNSARFRKLDELARRVARLEKGSREKPERNGDD